MDIHTLPEKARKRRRRRTTKILAQTDKRITIEASSLQDFFKKSLRGMAHELKRGVCSGSNHYDCTMKVVAKATDSKAILVSFLSQVLELTYAHHTIFCTMYIEELTERKIVACLYGNWFDDFDTKIKSIGINGYTIERRKVDLFTASILFES